MGHTNYRVDHAAHLLHFGGRAFPCDRDVVADSPWHNDVLLLSADTDCLSLWDADGLIRTARVGVYPQDMAVQADSAYICGGADSRLHRLHLPSLRTTAEYPLPGMPERLCLHNGRIFLLSLLSEPHVCTALLRLDPISGNSLEIMRFEGIPGALAADDDGLWVGVSNQAVHLPHHENTPDVVIEGIGLPEKIEVLAKGIMISDALEDRRLHIPLFREQPEHQKRAPV